MAEMNEALLNDLRAILADEFTGSITLHVEKGSVKRVETQTTWRPQEGRGVEISEEGNGA